MTLSGDRLNYPVSTTRAIFDSTHAPLSQGQLEEVHRFEWRRTNWTILWSLLDITPDTWDLSDEINALVAAHQGEGVIDLAVDVSNCALSYVPIMTVLPFWPSCANVVVRGAVVRRLRAPATTPAAAPNMVVSRASLTPPTETGGSQ
jgi:hypothetical protein